MKTESVGKYVARLAITLLLITSVVAAALAGVNSITAPAIAALTAEKTQMAIQAVLPGGGESIDFAPAELVSKVYKGENGYAIEVTPGGFDNTITMMVGIDTEGRFWASPSSSTRKLPVWALWLLPVPPQAKASAMNLSVHPAPFPSPRTAARWRPSPVQPSLPGQSVKASMPPLPARQLWVKEAGI